MGSWDPDGRHWYIVRAGDTLFGLAKRFYGNGNLNWRITQGNPGGRITTHNLNHPRASIAGLVGKCIWVPFTQRTHQCNLRRPRDSTLPGRLLWERFDRINRFVADKMVERSRDGADGLGVIIGVPPLDAGVVVRWIQLVKPGGDWDIKYTIADRENGGRSPFWTAVRDDPAPESLRTDLWGLVHYAYVGRAHRFSELDLRVGNWCCGGKQGDDDNFAMDLGFRLWNEHPMSLTAEQLRQAIRHAMPQFRRFSTDAVKIPLKP